MGHIGCGLKQMIFPLIKYLVHPYICTGKNPVEDISVVKSAENHNRLIGRICCLLPTDDWPLIESVGKKLY